MKSLLCLNGSRIGISLLVVLAIAPGLVRRPKSQTETIQGTVTDANGAVVRGAKVEIRTWTRILLRTCPRMKVGLRRPALPSGNIRLPSQEGFATAVAESVRSNRRAGPQTCSVAMKFHRSGTRHYYVTPVVIR